MATKAKPKGFRYTIIRSAVVDELTDTILYLRKKKKDKHTKAVPIPKDRKLLGECIAGGKVEDLVKGVRVTAKYDPKGVVRPQIVIEAKTAIEVLDNATVLDRGGNKLYLITEDKQKRGFEIEGGAKAWNDVVAGGNADGLIGGAKVKVEHDPSGRQPLKITILADSPNFKKKAAKGKGCGCSSLGPRSEQVPLGSILLLVALAGAWAWRRSAEQG